MVSLSGACTNGRLRAEEALLQRATGVERRLRIQSKAGLTMDAVVQVRGRLLAASENSVAGSRDWLDPILAHQFVGRWCVELPNQPRAEHFSIEELLVKTRLIDLNGEALDRKSVV